MGEVEEESKKRKVNEVKEGSGSRRWKKETKK